MKKHMAAYLLLIACCLNTSIWTAEYLDKKPTFKERAVVQWQKTKELIKKYKKELIATAILIGVVITARGYSTIASKMVYHGVDTKFMDSKEYKLFYPLSISAYNMRLASKPTRKKFYYTKIKPYYERDIYHNRNVRAFFKSLLGIQ
jgi:hypothetical protein